MAESFDASRGLKFELPTSKLLKKKPAPPPKPDKEKKVSPPKKPKEKSDPPKIELSGSNEKTKPPKVESNIVDNDKPMVKTEGVADISNIQSSFKSGKGDSKVEEEKKDVANSNSVKTELGSEKKNVATEYANAD